MSRMLLVVTLAVIAALGGVAFAWKFGFESRDVGPDIAPAAVALHAHLAADGIPTQVLRVRNMSAHAVTRAHFRIRAKHEQIFFVYACRSAQAAALQFEESRKFSPQTRPEINGTLVLETPDNPSDPVFDQVRRSFRTFRDPAAIDPPAAAGR